MREMQGVGRRPRVTAWNTARQCVQRVFTMLCIAPRGLAGTSAFAKTATRLTARTSPSFVDDCGTTGFVGSFFRAALIGVLMLIGGAAHAQTWTKIASEGASFSVSGTQTVRYGAGSSWIQKTVSDSGTCTNAYFGSDPAFGTIKECDVLNSASSTPSQTWTKIASEGASFSVSGTQTVRYGAGSTWIQQTVSGSGTCTNTYFGSDPVFGTTKECDVLNSASSTPTQSWTKIASEGASFSVSGTQTVRYGAGSTWIQKAVSDSGTCTNAYFGNDPAFGTIKECDVLNSASSTPTTTVLTASANPVSIGQSITLTASITGANPTGTVTFKDGETTLGTGAINAGNATLATSFSTSGSHSLTAAYAGDASNAPSTSSGVTETINLPTSSTTLNVTPGSITAGDSVTLTANVSGVSPTGNVTFKDGAAVLGTASLSTGAAILSTAITGAGPHSLTASYAGDAGNGPSSSTTASLTVSAASTSTALTAAPNPVAAGGQLVLTAEVSGASPSGTVTFSDGGTVLGTAALVSGQASLSTSLGVGGVHSLIANYVGDASNTASTSSVASVQVGTTSSTTLPGGMTWQYGYDAEGNRTTVVDPNGNQTSTAYDPLQRPSRVTQPAPGAGQAPPVISMGYDGRDQLNKVTDPRSLVTSYTVDGLGNVKATASPDSGTATRSYDAAGNLTSSTDARGKTTTYTYDSLNRLTSATYASGTPTVFQYDGGSPPVATSIGKLSKITDESGSTSYSYDGFGRITTKTQVVGIKTFIVSYTWGTTGSATGKLTAITYPSGNRVNYGYDAAGRVNAVSVNPVNANGAGTSGSTLNVLAGIGYNGANDILNWTWSDGTAYQRTYDGFGRLATYPLGNPAGTGASAGLMRTLSYDNAGRILGFTHTNAGGAQTPFDQGFAYDGLDRVNETVVNGNYFGYGYDATGNRTDLTTSSGGYLNKVDPASNRLTSVQTAGTGGTVTNTYLYDAAGNITSNGNATYSYSDRGRMSSATVAGSTVSYKYNGLEQRMSKIGILVPTGAAYFAYNEAGQLIGEYDASLNPIFETVYLNGTPVAVLKPTGSAASSTLSTSVSYAYADHLDTTRVIARSSGHAIVWRWDTAEVFGNTSPDENPNGLSVFRFNQRFPGQVFDQETGNFQNVNREYKPGIGRYAQSDPMGLAGGINTYAYVRGNTLSRIDPLGLADYIGLDRIAIHLETLARAQGDNFWKDYWYAPEVAMLSRLRIGAETPYDVGFYLHEKAEADMCQSKLNGPLDQYLEQQKRSHDFVERSQKNTQFDRYHPDVVNRFPDLFPPRPKP
ncbi:MAG: Ig-like domain repeat protein [Burkholderiales bacterium]|nr:Ig-like domain repeat protein [Burkholderiales bacterium]